MPITLEEQDDENLKPSKCCKEPEVEDDDHRDEQLEDREELPWVIR